MRYERFGTIIHWAITLGLACTVTASSVITLRLQQQIMRNNMGSYSRDIKLWEANIRHLEQAHVVVEVAENQRNLLQRELDKEANDESRFEE